MTVVVGFAATPEGRAALRWGTEECRLRGARLVVVVSGNRDADGEVPGAVTDVGAPLAAAAEVEDARAQLAAVGLDCQVLPVADGKETADVLIDAAEQAKAGVIVIGLRRRTPVGKLILGSNIQRVLLDAPCPVLAVKAEGAAESAS
jgi:nucleotide-binding universal stress UspA family protein